MRAVFLLGSILSVAAAAGCATAPPVNERTESSTAAIRAAAELGANNVPRASLHLQLAKEESEHAKGLAAAGEKEKAASLLLRAEADANLAVALSREDTEKSEAAAALERVRQLKQDNK